MDIQNSGNRRRSALSFIMAARHDPVARILNVDLLAVLTAILLPWSTTGVAIGISLWLIALVPTIDFKALPQWLKRRECFLPIALFGLACVGTLWSDAPPAEYLRAISPTAKLLVLPLLLYHFHRSHRGTWVLVAFLISCLPLMILSLVTAIDPAITLKSIAHQDFGIFIKDRIAQSQEFSLCAVALFYPISTLWRKKQYAFVPLLLFLMLSLIGSMAFIAVSRTALIATPVMMICAVFYFRWTNVVRTLGLVALLVALAWTSAPLLRSKVASVSSQYDQYKSSNEPTSVGLRFEFWRKSIEFFEQAPLIGHGTGSTRALFEQAAIGQTGAAAEVIGNPHNQTLYVAVQWGMTGVLVLYAMWLVHLLMFCRQGLANWIGLLVVVQNFTSSLFNSHLFDFHEGWIYVLGVGVAGGMTLGVQSGRATRRSEEIFVDEVALAGDLLNRER
jgi:O-antigen ligase